MKTLLNAFTFFLIGFIVCGTSSANAKDWHDVIGIIAGVGVIHEILDDRKEHREHHEDERYVERRVVYEEPRRQRRDRRWTIHDDYNRRFGCSYYSNYRNCRKIYDGDRTIIIIER